LIPTAVALNLLLLNVLGQSQCNEVLQAWRYMGGSTSYTNGCTLPGVSVSGSNVIRIIWDSKGLNKQISPRLGNLSHLTELWLLNNRLTGSIPIELGKLSKLQLLNIQNNRLTGSIPIELGNLSNLNYLVLYNNRLTGSIPKEFGNLSNLNYLVLYFNQLTGSIPKELGNLSNLTRLDLGHNQLTGSIPLALIRLQKFSIQYNPLINVSNIGTFKSSSFDSDQIKRYLTGASRKRAIAATVPQVETLCSLNDAFEDQEILNQCLAGVTSHCSSANNFGTCKKLYDETFRESVFKNMEICAPWNFGSKSTNCTETAITVKSRFTAEAVKYKQQFVDFIKNDLFSNREFAPCYVSTDQKCNY
jgi:Leucine-rich repeat (LRR) protein